MGSIKLAHYAVPFWLIILMTFSGTISGILAYRLLTNVNINVEVKEPIEILDYYPTQFSLYPGETATFNITVLNHAPLNYSVVLDFNLNDAYYQNHYVTFSDEVYTVVPGQQNVTGWLQVKPDAPPKNFTLTVGVERGGPVAGDFLTYQEIDPNSHIMMTMNHIDFNAFRDENAYVYKDKGADYFGSNWQIKVDVRLGGHFGNGEGNFFALANDVGNWKGILSSGGYELCAWAYSGNSENPNYGIGLNEGYNGIDTYRTTYYNVSVNTWYYCTIERSGLIVSMKIYSDSARTDLLHTSSLTLHSGHGGHRYVYAAQSFNTGHHIDINIEIENLIIS